MLIVGNGAGWDLGLFGICGKDGAGFRSSSWSGDVDGIISGIEV
jgi:hypothetical protein